MIGLTDRNKLYANDRLLSSDCTSFFVHNDFLVLTTFGHTARFVEVDIGFDGMFISLFLCLVFWVCVFVDGLVFFFFFRFCAERGVRESV